MTDSESGLFVLRGIVNWLVTCSGTCGGLPLLHTLHNKVFDDGFIIDRIFYSFRHYGAVVQVYCEHRMVSLTSHGNVCM